MGRGDRRAGSVALICALATLLVATACSGGGSTPKNVTLRVVMTDDWVTGPFTDAVRQFEREHPGVRVDVEKSPINKMADVARAGISNGNPPDVLQGHAVTGAGQNLAEPVDDLWAKYKVKPAEYLPGAVEDVTWGGRRYGLPLDSNAMAILYNADRFAAAGVSPPQADMTFAEFERMARALTSVDGSQRALVVPIDNWVTYGWIKSDGGETMSVGTDGKPRFGLNSPPVVETVAFLQHLIDAGLAFGPVGPDARSTDAYALFRSGVTAMYATGSWDLVRINKDLPNGHFGVADMPAGATGTTDGTAMGGSSLWIAKGAKHRDLAFQFMRLLTSDSYALRFAKEEGRLPVRPRLFSDPAFADAKLHVFVDQLADAHPPILGALYDASQAFGDALGKVFRDNADAKQTLDDAQTRAVASVGS